MKKLVQFREDQKKFIKEYAAQRTQHNENAAIRELIDIAVVQVNLDGGLKNGNTKAN